MTVTSSNQQDPSPPYNREAEEALIGSIIINDEVLIEIADLGLTPNDFYTVKLGWIFEAIVSLDRSGTRIDMVTLSDQMQRENRLDDIGGAAELTRLLNVTPSSINGRYYAGIVRRDSLMRKALDYAGMVAKLAYSGQDAEEVISQIEAGAMDLVKALGSDEGATLADIALKFIDILEERAKSRGIIGLPTGLVDLDRLMGGLKRRKVYTLAARPAIGKSTLAAQIALRAAQQQRARVLFFTLEMDQIETFTRLLSNESGTVPGRSIDNATLDQQQWQTVYETLNRLNLSNFKIIDIATLTMAQLRQKAISFWARGGIDLIVIDYLQLMVSDGKKENRQAEVAALSRGIKVLAGQLNVPILLLSQLNRGVESRYDKRPQLSDLRESGAIEQDSDAVIFLYNPDQDIPNVITAYVAKHRGGPTGDIGLFFRKEIFRFELADLLDAGSPPPAAGQPARTSDWQERFDN